MKPLFRSKKAAESHQTAGEESSVAVSTTPEHHHPHHHRQRTHTANSWTGSFGQDLAVPQAKPLVASKLVYEEGMSAVLYLLGSSVLHIVVRVATETMEASTLLARTSSSMTALESFLQASWLYYTSTTTANPVTNNLQPILSARIASWRLGRLRLQELAIIALTHAAIVSSRAWLPFNVLNDKDMLSFSMAGFLQTSLQAALCVVLLFVGPTILQINRLPPSLVILVLRPPFLICEHLSRILELLASQVLAGYLAGWCLERVFPDDPIPVVGE